MMQSENDLEQYGYFVFRFTIDRPEFEDVSPAAKDLLLHLMEMDPCERYTAEQALRHEYFLTFNSQEVNNNNTINNNNITTTIEHNTNHENSNHEINTSIAIEINSNSVGDFEIMSDDAEEMPSIESCGYLKNGPRE